MNKIPIGKLQPHLVAGAVGANICRPDDKDWYCKLSRFFSAIMMLLFLIILFAVVIISIVFIIIWIIGKISVPVKK